MKDLNSFLTLLMASIFLLASCGKSENRRNSRRIIGEWEAVSGYEGEVENEGLVEAIWTFDDTYLTTQFTYDTGEVESDGSVPYVIEGDILTLTLWGTLPSEIINLTNTDMTLRINTAFGSHDFVFEKR